MAFAQTKGSAAMQAYVRNNVRYLNQLLDESDQWAGAQAKAEEQAERDVGDWELFEKLAAGGPCTCVKGRATGTCAWRKAVDEFLERNKVTIDRQELAASLRRIVVEGAKKTTRVPLLVGPRNSGKTTYFDPVDQVFGYENVLHKPALGSNFALANMRQRGKRFLYWDDYRPVEFAATGTVDVPTFLSLFQSDFVEIKVSQSFQDGNSDMAWLHGACMTAKDHELWKLIPPIKDKVPVTAECIHHMQGRVEQFTARVSLEQGGRVLRDVPKCKESFCKLIVEDSTAFALREVPSAVPPATPSDAAAAGDGADQTTGLGVTGFANLMRNAKIPPLAAAQLLQDGRAT